MSCENSKSSYHLTLFNFFVSVVKQNMLIFHKESRKCTPKQIMLYKLSINLHKTFNSTENFITTETIRLFEQTISNRRQTLFEVYRNNNKKIGMNTAANKFYHINKLVGLDKLNMAFVHYKKIMKIQFLKYGKT